MNIFFKEEQRFSQWWFWLIMLGIGSIPIFGIYKQFILGEKFGNNPMSNLGLIIFSVFILGLITVFFFMRLKTEIDSNGIRMEFLPLAKKYFLWEDVKSVKIIKYRFVGYGLRLSITHGTVYNTSGTKGLSIELTNGKKYLIGTQKELELQAVLKRIENNKLLE
ncbi:hypothetical protein OS188_03955 [Xanthomarina sp. F1114]|uniref:hypothetical protein n=1 Tax=Xanthomarina sp. F1114 TaxID=2996019 RepID=UPI00225E20E7|nr:hypothetical protein [Xanthomarina sp. F1114]MCX7547102.1 hypothetical protein [Xanthomarina sp. F1114]